MIRSLVISSVLITAAFAQDFEALLNEAMLKSPYLRTSDVNIERSKELGASLQRYENPNIELEVSSFDGDVGGREEGYRVALTQPLRLWGVPDDKKRYADALTGTARAEGSLRKAGFIRDISLMYLGYVQSQDVLLLGKEEQKLGERIYEISQERFNAGTISRGRLLQARIDLEMAQSAYERLQIEADSDYMRLLKSAGIEKEISVDVTHKFVLRDGHKSVDSPEQLLWQARSDESTAWKQVNTNSVEWVDLYGEYEKEPDQSISRIGVDIPLALFNTKSQERQIAGLEARRSRLLRDTASTQQDIEVKRLEKESTHLRRLEQRLNSVLQTELELLEMFEEGYKIANINLLELQDVKDKVIDTKRELIDVEIHLQANIIHQNYLQGSYNE